MSVARVSRWEPCFGDRWTQLIDQTDSANLGQAQQWFAAIRDAYGHSPVYLQAEDDQGQFAVLPAFLIRRMFGRVLTSMPFLDAGGPCGSSQRLSRVVVDSLIVEASRLGASELELRCTEEIDLSSPPRLEKVSLILALPDNPERLWRLLGAKTRNQIRRSERSGLSVEFGGTEKLDDFYKVFAANMRELGSPVHSKGFFKSIFDAFGEKARVSLVRKGVLPVGGLIALEFRNTLVVPWASSLRQFFSLCPNMLLYWETLRRACTEGFQRFDFGRSTRDSGTYHFKRQWGAVEQPLYWYTIPIGCDRNWQPSADGKQAAAFVQIWKRLPLQVTRWFGPLIRKYLTQ